MRNKATKFLCLIVAGVGLLAASEAGATGTCSAAPTVEVVKDQYDAPTPCPVVSIGGTNWRCAGDNEATEFSGIRYKNNQSTSNLATLVTRNNVIAPNGVPTGSGIQAACKGDPVTQLGFRSCHEIAIKINGVANSGTYFWVVVKGRKVPVETSMATKPTGSGNTVKCFPITGFGLDASSDELVQQVERVTSQDGCVLEFFKNSLTGGTSVAKLTPESVAAGCTSPTLATDGATITPADASDLEIKFQGQTLGLGKFGEGYIRSGQNSCTTRIIGGRVYTWGNPCPEN